MLHSKHILLMTGVLSNLVFLEGNESPSNENCTAHLLPPEKYDEYLTTKEASVQEYREYLKKFEKMISNETLYGWYKEDVWKSDQRIINLIEKSLGEIQIPSAQREIGCLPGHVMFVGLFSFYKKPPTNSDEYNSYPKLYDEYSFLRCGTEVDEDAIIKAQTFLAQLKVFNIISKIVTNRSTEIGAYLVDDCQSEIVARYQLMRLYNRTYSQPFTSDECSLNLNQRAPIIGMYPPSSGILYTFLFDEFLTLLKIPKFDKVIETGPTDVRELLIILEHFDWRYISLVYEEGYYNEDKFKTLSETNRICIYKSWRMFETDSDNLIIVKQLVLEEPANVVVIICHNSTLLTSFMRAVETLNATDELLFVTNQNWLPEDWTFEKWTAKFLTFSRHSSRTITENWKKLAELHLSVNNDSAVNPWFKKYWAMKPICSVGIATEEAFLKELLTEYTIYREYEKTCADQNCAGEFLDRNYSRRLEYFCKSKQRWHGESHTIKLTMQPGDIYLGYYVNDNSETSQFTIEDNSSLLPFQSRCSEECGPKEIKSMTISTCCWTCTLCALSQPNEDQTACVPLPVIPFRWNDVEIVISVVYSTCVVIVTAITFFIFIKYRNTPAVKSTTRELSFMMLMAMLATESIVFIFMFNQQSMTITCHAIRVIVFVSFTTMYGALLMRTVRIARLLSLPKNEFPPLKLRFMSGLSQVVITLTLIAMEFILVLAVYPDPNYDYAYNDNNLDSPMRKPYCILDTSSVIINFSFVFILVIACTGCAVWVRNVPENFNEAKHIGFCMYTTCLTWLASGFMFLDKTYQVFTLCICVTTNTLVVLIFLFFPKLYIIIKKPESNDKRYFHAIKGIRCKMFTSSGPSISSVIPS